MTVAPPTRSVARRTSPSTGRPGGRPARSGRFGRSARARRDRRDRLIFLGPLLTLMTLLIAFPLGFAIYVSFADIDNLFSLEFIGTGNFEALFRDAESLLRPFGNTLRYALVVVLLQLVIGFGAALMLNSKLRGRRWFRTAMMMPWVIPSVVAALTWRVLVGS